MSKIKMMLSALQDDEKCRITIGLDSLEKIRKLSDERRLHCPNCNSKVILKAGKVKAHHFAHWDDLSVDCSDEFYEPESPEHQAMKLAVLKYLKAVYPEASVEMEVPIPETGQRADVLAIINEKKRIAVEVQISPLTEEEWLKRHQLYASAKIDDIWLVGFSRYKFNNQSLENEWIINTQYPAHMVWFPKIPEMEKAIGKTTRRVFYLDVLSEPEQPRLIMLCQIAIDNCLKYTFPFSAEIVKPYKYKDVMGLKTPYDKFVWEKKKAEIKEFETHQQKLETFIKNSLAKRKRKLAILKEKGLDTPQWLELKAKFKLKESDLEIWEVPVPSSQKIDCDPRIWMAWLYYHTVKQKYRPGQQIIWPEKLAQWHLRNKFKEYLQEGYDQVEIIITDGFSQYLKLLGLFSASNRILDVVHPGFPTTEKITKAKEEIAKNIEVDYRAWLVRTYIEKGLKNSTISGAIAKKLQDIEYMEIAELD